MHLHVDISAHGLGHLAQTAPVIAALRRQSPGLRLTIASALPHAQLVRRIAAPFTHLEEASDFGFVMHNAIDIDYAASAARYQQTHADWPARVGAAAARLQAAGVDLLLANAAYLPLAAAAHAGIPAAGLCSLNWADLFAHYFSAEDWALPIQRQMLAAYNAAQVFLRVTPGMPMDGFSRRRRIGPIAALATEMRPAMREHIADLLQLPTAATWVLVAMGGMEFRLPVERWPVQPGVFWLCPQAWEIEREDVRSFDGSAIRPGFTDLLAACDAVLTKPGYGTFVEAACNGVPVLYVPRDNWPEEAPLVHWLQQHGRSLAVARPDLLAGNLGPALHTVLSQTAPARPPASGSDEAAQALLALLG